MFAFHHCLLCDLEGILPNFLFWTVEKAKSLSDCLGWHSLQMVANLICFKLGLQPML